MIFTLELNFRNCLTCKKKVVFSMDQCENCHAPFAETNQMIMQVQQETRQRMQFLRDGGEVDPNQVRFSKFYLCSPSAGYHHIFGIPLYTLEEALIVQNLMYRGLPPQTKTLCSPQPEWIASFCAADQDGKPPMMRLRSWQPLLWDEDQQVYLAGPDEGPRIVQYTPWD